MQQAAPGKCKTGAAQAILRRRSLTGSELLTKLLDQLEEHSPEKARRVKSLSRIRLFATPRTVVHQAPLSMEFSRQEYRSVLPLPSPGDLPDPGIEPGYPALQADALPSEPPGKS